MQNITWTEDLKAWMDKGFMVKMSSGSNIWDDDAWKMGKHPLFTCLKLHETLQQHDFSDWNACCLINSVCKLEQIILTSIIGSNIKQFSGKWWNFIQREIYW